MLELWIDSLIRGSTETLDFQPANITRKRELKQGHKSVKDIFELGMVLCCIMDMLDGNFGEDDVTELHSFITRYNTRCKDTLGSSFIMFNNHIAEHIPDAVRRFGAPRNFSCLPFE